MKQTFTHLLKKELNKLFFFFSVLLTSVSALAQNPVSTTLGFNVFAESNVTMQGGTVDGAIASGGSFTINGGSQYNANGVFLGANPYVAIGGKNYALVVDGTFVPTSGYFNVNGSSGNNWIKIGNLNGATSGTSNSNQIKITKNNAYIQVNSTNQTFSQVTGSGLVNFAAAFAALRSNSLGLSTCPNTVSPTYLLGNPTVSVSGTKNIWNITGAQLNSFSYITFSLLGLPSANRPLVINVNAAGAFNLKMPLMLGLTSSAAPYIIFNFYNTTNITYNSGNTINGTILAPNAAFNKTGSQTIQGQIISSSYTQSAGSVQVSPFNANVTSCVVCPTATSAGTNVTQCGNNVFNLSATAAATGATGTWSVVSGAATIASPNSPTASATVTTSPATLRWTLSLAGCTGVSADVVLTNTVVSSSNAGAAQSKCSNNVFTMAANAAAAGETGIWSVTSGAATIANTSSATTSVTVTTSPATLSWKLTKGTCTSTSTVVLTNTTITIAKTAGAQTQCSNPSFTLNGNTPATGETGTWSVVSGAASIASINSPTSAVTVTTSPATLAWTITKGSCATSATAILINTNVTAATAGPDQTGTCGGKGKFTLAANAVAAGETGFWTVVSGAATIDNINSPTSNVSVITSPAVLSWTIKNGACSTSSTVTFTANAAYKIVVLGSSTAYGTGATPMDSSWVNKFAGFIKAKNLTSQVINLAVPGYTTYQALCPNNFIAPANRPAVDTLHNITAALKLLPDAIVINLPTNDVANNYTVTEQQANYERTIALANAANIPVWVTTTQPRNGLSVAQIDSLQRVREWTYSRFGAKAIDFWTTVAAADGSIDPTYNYDGVHVNNAGHDIFYRRIAAEGITDSLCNRRFNKIPVANAGNDTLLLLPANSFVLDGSASADADGTIAAYQWMKIAGHQNAQVASPASVSTTVNNLVEGIYSFELTVTDNTGATKKDTITITVGTRVLIDAGVPANTSGTPDNAGKYWNNLTSAALGVQVANAVTINNQPTAIALEVVNRLDGTFDSFYNGVTTGNTIGAVGDYPVSATVDYAFAHPTATNGQWKFTGLDASKQYSFKFWGTKSADTRFTQIKRADETNWQEYDAGYNTDYNRAAYFTFTGKTEMSFDIRVKDGSSFGYISVVDITRTSVVVPANNLPIAKAGNDTTVILPASSIALNGSNSSDNDGAIVAYQWTKISGPSSAQINNASGAATTVNNLTEGVYTFELTVTDNNGGVSKDSINVTVGDRILIDAGYTTTSSPDDGGKNWNNITTGAQGVQLSNAVTTTNTATAITLEVVNRIDGTFDPSYNGVNGNNNVGPVGDYPATATVDFAFAEPSATNGQWKFSGLDAGKQYSFKFWGSKGSANRSIQIKRADETNWQEYDAAFNADFNKAAYFTFSGKTEMSFDIRVKDGSSYGYINVVDITSASLTAPVFVNRNTVASRIASPKNDEVKAQPSATLYPNPSDGNFTIAVPVATKNNPVSIDIVNSFGQSVYHTTSASNGNIAINLAGKLSSGVYMIKIRTNGIETIRRAVIKRG